MLNSLPQPSAIALSHSEKLVQKIREEMDITNDGALNFARYMELVLYAPGLGYYSAGARKFGEEGDFVTAPEISPLFARCIAKQCQQVLMHLAEGSILEFGAGSGAMAAEILLELEREHCLPDTYFILEVSAELRQRQQKKLQQSVPHLFSRVIWLDRLPSMPFDGIVLANEVLDAMPIHRFYLEGDNVQEFYVRWQEDRFAWQMMPLHVGFLYDHIQRLRAEFFPKAFIYESEINFLLFAWLNSIKVCLKRGLVLLIDYGFPAREYYHPDRMMGTLMCHYRQHVHTDPFYLPGLQDVTAHVDFTALAESAAQAGFNIIGFTTQAAFLLACDLLTYANILSTVETKQQLTITQQIQKLTAPHEMGELFKVIALTCGLDNLKLIGFSLQDRRRSL